MADETKDRWPDWRKPATKGDIVSALVDVNGCLVEIALTLSAAQRGDSAAAEKRTVGLFESLKKLSQRIEAIGGNNDG
jgi:hypothetical protein